MTMTDSDSKKRVELKATLPVYSALDVTEEVVDPFSQSFSPFLLLERLGDRKPSAESGLDAHTRTQTQIQHVCIFFEHTAEVHCRKGRASKSKVGVSCTVSSKAAKLASRGG